MEDYEREAAREWQQVGPPKKARHALPRKEVVKADFQQDTQALTQWRERSMPTKTMTLPQDFVPVEKGPGRGRGRGRNEGPSMDVPELAEIGRETETEIRQSICSDRRFHKPLILVSIYGSGEAADKAAEKIDLWVKSYVVEKKGRSAAWAKVNSVGTPEQRDKYLAKVREENERDSYRRDPPDESKFAAMGKFEWDTTYSTPGEVLGARLEACDFLRTELKCFIMPDKSQAATLRVLGHDHQRVKQALSRLRGSYFQAVSRDNAHRTGAVYLINPLSKSSQKCQIIFKPVFPPTANTSDMSHALGAKIQLQPAEIDDEVLRQRAARAEAVPAENAARLKKATVKALQTAKYFRGDLHMRATFGVFMMTRYRKGVNEFESFEDMMNEGDQVDGDVDANSAHLDGTVISNLARSPAINNPHDSAGSSKIPKPTYSTKFLLKHKSQTPDLKFEAEFDYDEEGDYVHIFSKRWARHMYDPGHSVKLLDGCLVDLESDSDAFSIDLDAMESIPESRAPELTEFAENVILNTGIATSVCPNNEKSTGRYIEFNTVPGVVVHWLVQKKHWTFEYGYTGYLVDVVKAEEFRLRNPTSNLPDQRALVHDEPKWRVSVYRKSWEIDFAENAHLRLGEGMRSNKTVADIFPTTNGAKTSRSDVAHFLQILNDVRDIIREDNKLGGF